MGEIDFEILAQGLAWLGWKRMTDGNNLKSFGERTWDSGSEFVGRLTKLDNGRKAEFR